LIAVIFTLRNLFSDPGVVTSNRISDNGETMVRNQSMGNQML